MKFGMHLIVLGLALSVSFPTAAKQLTQTDLENQRLLSLAQIIETPLATMDSIAEATRELFFIRKNGFDLSRPIPKLTLGEQPASPQQVRENLEKVDDYWPDVVDAVVKARNGRLGCYPHRGGGFRFGYAIALDVGAGAYLCESELGQQYLYWGPRIIADVIIGATVATYIEKGEQEFSAGPLFYIPQDQRVVKGKYGRTIWDDGGSFEGTVGIGAAFTPDGRTRIQVGGSVGLIFSRGEAARLVRYKTKRQPPFTRLRRLLWVFVR